MSFVLHQSDTDLLVASGPIVKAADRGRLADALALLDRLRRDAETAAARQRAAEVEAAAHGRAQGYDAGRRAFAEAIARLAEQANAHRVREEAEIATLAMTALRQIAGEIGDPAVMQGVALRAARTAIAQGPVVVEVAPAIAVEVEQGLAKLDPGAEVTVRPDPSLGERQCRISGPEGRIIADLDRQLDELAERWGVAHVD
jgi:type III secretion protein L